MLAIVGLYGVLAQMVAHRMREIAIRMAVGASRREVSPHIPESLCIGSHRDRGGAVGSAIAVGALAGLLYGVTD
jgi:hypothetical protein